MVAKIMLPAQAESFSKNKEAMQKILEALKALGVKDEQIETDAVRIDNRIPTIIDVGTALARATLPQRTVNQRSGFGEECPADVGRGFRSRRE